jgi:hypothetical protein
MKTVSLDQAYRKLADKQPRSDRPLKRTYAVAGEFIENHSIGQTLTAIARSGGLHYYTEGDEMEKN